MTFYGWVIVRLYSYHNFCIYSSVSGSWGGCSHVLAIVNSAAVNSAVHECFHAWLSQCVCPVVGVLSHRAVLFLDLKGLSILFSIVAISIYIPPQSARGFPFLHATSAHIVSRFFFFMISFLAGVRWCIIVALVCISFMMSGEHLILWGSAFLLKKRFRITENLADSIQSSYRTSLFLHLASCVINILDWFNWYKFIC